MTTQTEALKLALEALENVEFVSGSTDWVDDCVAAAEAIKKALAQPEQERCVGCEACIDTACGRDECPKGWPKAAQPEQEPVAWMDKEKFEHLKRNSAVLTTVTSWGAFDDDVALYTTPPQRTWVGLTDEEIDELFEYGLAFERPRVIYREIEAKLKEKNT